MLRAGVTRLRLLLLAAVVAVAGGAWPRLDAPAMSTFPTVDHPHTFEASTLVAALPLRLESPLEPGLRVVALAASDIDDDGDLDLVASDGSLDLLVWINDGAGHMTRRYGRQSSGWRNDPSDASNDTAQGTVSAVASAGFFIGSGNSVTQSLNHDAGSHKAYEPSDLAELIAGSQSPRAPPLSLLTL
jgi:hypothetical protein